MHYQQTERTERKLWADAPVSQQLNFMNDRPSYFEINVQQFWGEVRVWRAIAEGIVFRLIERVVNAPEPQYAYDSLTLLAC
ncbi:hypothetical protein H6F53_13320 [Trichocoleus sp. FACHB-832]|uniref:hypothetical protein n=1 Tax=Trichocoleus sp. FACHB-832 TaxID=2692875 RepID=UPI00168247C1|nr:hypothetical protein [Trichocoleus sp. FACHB-832]MBD1906457.1 hypothetical protein [Trichocoleus sp. FACHB-832]